MFSLKKINKIPLTINLRYLSNISNESNSNVDLNKEENNRLLFEQIKSEIFLKGPLTLSSYMKQILTNPYHGYYIQNKNVFGCKGDFITSPEITQIFGELISIWLINEMNKINTSKIDIIELGPGRGTLMKDMLRTFEKFNLLKQINEIHLVEISNELSKQQSQLLCVRDSIETNECMEIDNIRDVTNRIGDNKGIIGGSSNKIENKCMEMNLSENNIKDVIYRNVNDKEIVEKNSNIIENKGYNKDIDQKIDTNRKDKKTNSDKTIVNANEIDLFYQKGVTKSGITIKWYKSIFDVPQTKFSFILAHEFFDALPIHKFIKSESGWKEVLIDFNSQTNQLEYVLSKNQTPACMFIDKNETRTHIEISPETGVIVQNIAKRLEEKGGIGLIIDYGHNGTGTDTFRAYFNHKQTDPLKNIGRSDLTADVDFKYIKNQVKDKLIAFGPIKQGYFLKQMHIDARLNALLNVCSTDAERQILQSAVQMLIDEDQMGARFQFLALFPLILKEIYDQYPVYAFQDDTTNEQDESEWGLIELQGDLESRNDTSMKNKFVGDLHIQKNGTPVLIIGHHILHGKIQKLEKPFVVLKKVETVLSNDLEKTADVENFAKSVEYEITMVITRKMIFKTRPKPIVVAPDP